MQKTVNSKIENYLRNYSHLFGLRFFRNYKQTKKKNGELFYRDQK